MFGTLTGNNGDRCSVCRGDKVLEVIVYNAMGKPHKHLPDIECDACDGKGYVMTAARAARVARYQG